MASIQTIQADITTLKVDAIVNAANTSLLGGGGVDGAIHRAAGPMLKAACAKLHGCATGQAKITPGFNLPAKFVIHAVGPVWNGGTRGEDDLLAGCYQHSLQLAAENKLQSIAFSAISTGVYGFPVDRAADIAAKTVDAFFAHESSVQSVIFVCFSDRAVEAFSKSAAQWIHHAKIS